MAYPHFSPDTAPQDPAQEYQAYSWQAHGRCPGVVV